MKRYFYYLVIFLCWNCQRPEAATAVATAELLNHVLTMLVQQYEKEALKAVEISTSREEAELVVDAVDLRWKPVWIAWEGLRVAQDRWATNIEGGTEADAYETMQAWCKLHAALLELGSVPHVIRMISYEC